MTVMLDIIFASVIAGMIILMVMNVNINLSDENYRGMVEFNTQMETIQLARIIEFDFYKVGYTITGAARPAITIAESSHIKFKTNLKDISGATDIVEYGLGDYVLNSKNPLDKMLFRIENITKVYINYSVIDFSLAYFDSTDTKLVFPITGANLDKIRSVKIRLRLESPEPFDTTRAGGRSYTHAMYQKLIYPRNLQ
ncbi:MAG: hypothetical protein HZB59_03545 [Ignavibacteriales bacterium]|nr:hypothetical protein [Ignavibacteriales bacterium]